MKNTEIQNFIHLSKEAANDYLNKIEFHKLGKKVCKEIAKELGLNKGEFDVRSNLGGQAVSGEITLHGEFLYLQFSGGMLSGDVFMYRSCNGRKDYSGGPNRWMNYSKLLNIPSMCLEIRQNLNNKL